MALTQEQYEELRDEVISKFKVIYKDDLAMDICEVPKDVRIRMFEDEYYIRKTKAIKAGLFLHQLEILEDVIGGVYSNSERPTDQSANVLKALDMKQKLLLEDLNVTKDESNALNVTFIGMSREDFLACKTVEVNEGGNSVELGADFGAGGEEDSFEARIKAKTQEKLKELEENKGE